MKISREQYITDLESRMPNSSQATLEKAYEQHLAYIEVFEQNNQEIEQLKEATKLFVANNAEVLSDDEAASLDLLFPDWEVGANYKQGDIVRYKDQLFRIGKGTIN